MQELYLLQVWFIFSSIALFTPSDIGRYHRAISVFDIDIDIHTKHWRIWGGRARRTPPPPHGTQFFHFHIHFHRRVPMSEVHAPPPLMGARPPPPPPLREILDPPLPSDIGRLDSIYQSSGKRYAISLITCRSRE